MSRVSASELRILIGLLSLMEAKVAEAGALIRDSKVAMPHSLEVGPAWAHLYDLPFQKHMGLAVDALGFGRELADATKSDLPFSAYRDLIGRAEEAEIDTEGVSDEEIERAAWSYLSLSFSMYHTMRCLMTFGRYINEMLVVAREGNDDKALLNAIRIDPTVVCTRTATVRMSRAGIEGDKAFFDRVRRAMAGKVTKRQAANFQKMRLIVRVLAESGANRFSDANLVKLFVEELRLYPSISKTGDVVKNLRKFVDEYLKLATTQK